MNIPEDIGSFMSFVAAGEVEIYNEFSLQHEFGIYLRGRYPNKKVQFERNVAHFGLTKDQFTKREIDIAVFEEAAPAPDVAIELKYPRNGQYPEQLFSFCKDIAFLEELRAAGFAECHFLAVAEDRPFYAGGAEGIYGYFRGGVPLHGEVIKPTGKKDTSVKISGNYSVSWQALSGSGKYVHIQIQSGI